MSHKKTNPPIDPGLLKNPVHFLSLGFGSGLAPKAPGTFGTLAAIPLWWLLVQTPWWSYTAAMLIAAVAGIWFCGVTSQALGVHDHSGIVWDEVAGLLVSLWLLPPTWQTLVAGFMLFRLFDIWKPWPIRWLDRKVHGGLGIMLDDLLAGAFTCLILHLWYAWF